jgi:hypothetical protein
VRGQLHAVVVRAEVLATLLVARLCDPVVQVLLVRVGIDHEAAVVVLAQLQVYIRQLLHAVPLLLTG